MVRCRATEPYPDLACASAQVTVAGLGAGPALLFMVRTVARRSPWSLRLNGEQSHSVGGWGVARSRPAGWSQAASPASRARPEHGSPRRGERRRRLGAGTAGI